MHPFHLAIPVSDLTEARRFYGGLLGCREGRSSDRWVDFDFFGNQLVAQLGTPLVSTDTNPVDGDAIPAFHFGVVLDMESWQSLVIRLKKAGADFVLEPKTRFKGKIGAQSTLFVRDPFGNILEFKALKNMSFLFSARKT